MIDRITDEEQDRAHQDTYESEVERSRTVTIPLREYEKLKEVQKTITNKDCISIIDKIEELVRAMIKMRIQDYVKTKSGYEPSSKRIVDTTVGRAIFSRILPKGLSFDLVNKALSKKVVSNLIHVCYRTQELKETVIFADQMMLSLIDYLHKLTDRVYATNYRLVKQ